MASDFVLQFPHFISSHYSSIQKQLQGLAEVDTPGGLF